MVSKDHSSVLSICIKPSAELSQRERLMVIDVCNEAYAEDFADWFDLFPQGTHAMGMLGEKLVSHAAWVTRWLQPAGGQLLRTAFVEAVATAPAYQRRGYAKAVLNALAAQITDYDLGALSPSDPAFYVPLGWEVWHGPLAIRTETGLLPTPDELIMIMRLKCSQSIDSHTLMTAEWRRGELW